MRTAEIPSNVQDHFGLRGRSFSSNSIRLCIIAKAFIGIQFWAMSRQKVEMNSSLVRLNFFSNCRGTVHRMRIDDKADLPRHLFAQSTRKTDEHGGDKSTLECHEVQSAAVGDCRDHAASKTLPCTRNSRSFPFFSERASCGMIRRYSHLCPVKLCTCAHKGMLFFQPLCDLLPILFKDPFSPVSGG